MQPCVMVRSGRRTGTQAAESVKMETTAGVRRQSGFICSAADNFSAPPKSSRARIDKRTARAARNTRYRYNKIGPLDHKMADNCVSLARTNTVSSTITKQIKTWKSSNESYNYNLLNRINFFTHMTYFIYNKSGKRGLHLSINRFRQLNHN